MAAAGEDKYTDSGNDGTERGQYQRPVQQIQDTVLKQGHTAGDKGGHPAYERVRQQYKGDHGKDRAVGIHGIQPCKGSRTDTGQGHGYRAPGGIHHGRTAQARDIQGGVQRKKIFGCDRIFYSLVKRRLAAWRGTGKLMEET